MLVCRSYCLQVMLAVMLLSAALRPAFANPEDRIGETLKDVTLKTLNGESVQLLDYHKGDILVLAYTGLGCPISNRYAPRLAKLSRKYSEKKGVHFVGINANPHDSLEDIKRESEELEYGFPILKDAEQTLTKQLDAKTTTVVFVIDKDRVIRYRGMIDDQYAVGTQRKTPKNKYLRDTLKSLSRGREVFVSRTVAPGCLITRLDNEPANQEITYADHIASIVQNNCQQCHREGQIAPFPLGSYKQVRGWSAMIYSVLQENRMPPWNAHHEFDGVFANQRSMDPHDKSTFMSWIKSGMARGDEANDPPAKEWEEDWRIGEPDKVFKMQTSYRVPAEGVLEYQYFKIPTRFDEDMWITAMEAKPGAPDVVHHILAFVVEGDLSREDFAGLGLENGYLCATVPGDTPSLFPEGTAKRLPKGASIWLQVHYTTNGKKRKDRCSLAMKFAEKPPEKEVKTRGIYNVSFTIPANAPNHEVRAEHTLADDTTILALYPHMHFRGKDWKYIAHYPDGEKEVLLDVPTYDYNWQESYILNEPKVLPKGTKIECIAHYDNTAGNFANPDPTKEVRFGEQSWEEMMIGYMDYVTN